MRPECKLFSDCLLHWTSQTTVRHRDGLGITLSPVGKNNVDIISVDRHSIVDNVVGRSVEW